MKKLFVFVVLVSILVNIPLKVSITETISSVPKNSIITLENKQAEKLKVKDGELYYWYSHCSKSEKGLYDEIVAHIKKGEAKFTPVGTYHLSDYENVFSYIYYDHPEFFWFEGYGGCEYYLSDKRIYSVSIAYNDLVNNLDSNKKKFDKKVKSILKETKAKSHVKQEKKIHDYLAKKIAYQHGSHDQNSYSAIVEGKTVCAGYARAFQYLMLKLGVPCYYCRGLAYSSNKNGWDSHAWNIVKMDDNKFYNVDVTWDDRLEKKEPNKFIEYSYFNITDKEINKDHIRDDEFKGLPSCSSKKYSFEKAFKKSKEQAVVEQWGIKSAKKVKSVKDYNKACYNKIVSKGLGTYKLQMLVYGTSTINKIMDTLNNGSYANNYIDSAMRKCGYIGYGYQVNLEYKWVGNDVYLLTQQFSFW